MTKTEAETAATEAARKLAMDSAHIPLIAVIILTEFLKLVDE